MNTIMKLFAVAFVCGAFSAQAADKYWKGSSGDNASLWGDSSNWQGGVPNKEDIAYFRADQVSGGFLGKTAFLDKLYEVKLLHVSKGSSENDPIVLEAKDAECGLKIVEDCWLGYYDPGALWLKSGHYIFGVNSNKGLHIGEKKNGTSNFIFKVGDEDGQLGVSLTANKNHPVIKGSSKFIACNSTLDFAGQNFNMYGTSSANIKDSEMTAKLLNVAIDEGNDCTAVFNGGSLTLSATSLIGYGKTSKGYMYATNLTLTITGDYPHLSLGGQDTNKTGATGVVDKKDGDWTIGGDLVIGAQGSSAGTFTTDGGSVTVGGITYIAKGSGSTGTLTIKNGTFTTKSISAIGTATLNIDGGTLKAGASNVNLINSGITVKVGAGGATIDTVGRTVTIASAVGDADGESGAITFTGGGTVTLSGAANWTGTTTVNAGTVLAFPADMKSKLVESGITVAIPEAGAGDGTTVLEITDGNGTFSEEEIAAMQLTGNSNGRYALVLADGGAKVKVAVSDALAGEYVWNGGSSGDSWRTDGNWSKNNVAGNWYDSTAAVFENAGDSAMVDSAVAAGSVTFRANATVGGTAVLTAPVVAVSNEVSATVNAPTAGALEKTGPGTLTLGASRSDVTTLSEGTLVMSGSGTSLDWSKFMFGAAIDATKPMTLSFANGASIAGITGNWDIGETGCYTQIVKEGGDWTVPGELRLGAAAGNVAEFVQNGGTMAVNGYLMVGYGDGTGTLTINSGTVEVAGEGKFTSIGAGCTGTINLNAGGTLKTKYVHWNSNASYTLAFNGGTLFALAKSAGDLTGWLKDKGLIHADVCVTVGDLGGTINANNLDNVIAAPIQGTGGMTFMGGGSVTLAAGNTYTGNTTVEVGTVVHVAAPGDIGGGLEVTLPDTAPAEDVYTLVTIEGEGTFAADLLTKVDAPENAILRLSGDMKSVFCVYGNPVNTWVGGSSGSLSEASNWSLGFVPQSGDSCVIVSKTVATLTVGGTFAPSSITFPADTALITINAEGEEAISGLATVENNSSQHHVIACPVDASAKTPALPLAESSYLVFSGGISLKAKAMPSVQGMRLAGTWNLDGDWDEPPSGTQIMPDSEVNVSGSLVSGYNIAVSEGATLKATKACVKLGASGKNRALYENKGNFVVSGVIENTIEAGSGQYDMSGFFARGGENAVTRVKGLVHAASTYNNHRFRLNNKDDFSINKIVLGSGGLSFRDNTRRRTDCYPYFQIDEFKSVELASSADWSFGANPVPGRDLCLELEGHLYIDTSDYDVRNVPHTVRVKGGIGNGKGRLTVNGCGKLLFEYAPVFGGGLYVKENATVSCNAGCGPTSCTIDVGTSAAFEVAESGVVKIGKGMALANGATLKFNFTERNKPPVIDFGNNSVSVAENGQVKLDISAQGFTRPAVGVYKLTEGLTHERGFVAGSVVLAENAPHWVKSLAVDDTGNVLLDVSVGTKIIVR